MKISIVTPSFNQRAFLERTLRSILQQAGDFELECIVMDGGSSDGTVEVLKGLSDSRVMWTSEKDRGQSDAINRGLARATGDVVAWLNSDDIYVPGALAKVAAAFANSATQWVVGRCEIIDGEDRVIRPEITRYKNRILSKYSYRGLLRQNLISQPATFWRRSFGESAGPLDESLHYTMDYDLWLRMGKVCDPVILEDVTSQFRIHSESKSGQVNREQFDEQFRVAERYLGNDRVSRAMHRLNVEKIVWAYRVMRLVGR